MNSKETLAENKKANVTPEVARIIDAMNPTLNDPEEFKGYPSIGDKAELPRNNASHELLGQMVVDMVKEDPSFSQRVHDFTQKAPDAIDPDETFTVPSSDKPFAEIGGAYDNQNRPVYVMARPIVEGGSITNAEWTLALRQEIDEQKQKQISDRINNAPSAHEKGLNEAHLPQIVHSLGKIGLYEKGYVDKDARVSVMHGRQASSTGGLRPSELQMRNPDGTYDF